MGAAAGYILSFAPLFGKPDKSGPVPTSAITWTLQTALRL